MAITALDAVKRGKPNHKLFAFHTFADPGCPVFFTGAFRDNIRLFLQECGDAEDYNIHGMPVWLTLLVNERNGILLPLYTIEERVKHSLRPFCDHCRCIGWSHHFLSKRRYHMIIPADIEWSKPLERGFLDVNNHLLHGLIHCNGFGHLIAINGHEGGSKHFSGREIMDLWDRICTSLCARKITVEDVSRKRSMDLRLLYGIAYEHCWFGRWGYKFCHGSYGVTEHNYESAIRILTSILLEDFIVHSAETGHRCRIEKIVRLYREVSETQLITVSDLFRFMLTLKAKAPLQRMATAVTASTLHFKSKSTPPMKPIRQHKSPAKEKATKYRKFKSFVNETANSRWPARRLEYAAEVIVEALRKKQGGMSRQEVRDAARLHIGDTGLLDFVIKSINNLVVGNYVVQRTVSPSTRVLEFTIKEVKSDHGVHEQLEPSNTRGNKINPHLVTNSTYSRSNSAGSSAALTFSDCHPVVAEAEGSDDVYQDIEYMYRAFKEVYPESEMVGLAIRVVEDSKHFAKEWPLRDEEDELLRFICGVDMRLESDDEFMDIGTGMTRAVMPPSEVVVVPPYTTIGELKREIEQALRDTYCMMEGYKVKEIEGVGEGMDEEVVFGRMESGRVVRVRGTGMEMKSKLRYEGGDDNWTVECSCGARDDDGERMLACDVCEVWQHTRCCGIQDDDPVPPLFVCGKCTCSLMPPLSDHHMDFDLDGY